MKKPLLTITALLILSLLFPSCKKNNDTAPGMGTVYLRVESRIEGSTISDASFLKDSLYSKTISITNAKCFMSGIALIRPDGSTYAMPGRNILVSTTGDTYLVGEAPSGTYTGIAFNIGLDKTTNAKPPYLVSATGYDRPASMWLGNTTDGYSFMTLEGAFDTGFTTAHPGKIPFSLKIARTADTLQRITMIRGAFPWQDQQPFRITDGGTQTIHLAVDYSQVLDPYIMVIQPENPAAGTTDTYHTNPGLAKSLAKLFHGRLFSYLE